MVKLSCYNKDGDLDALHELLPLLQDMIGGVSPAIEVVTSNCANSL